MLKNQTLSASILEALPELQAHFGADTQCQVALIPKNVKLGHTFKFESARGIVYGESESTDIQIFCNSTSSPTESLALTLQA
jgi:hypothetical protein